MRKLIFICLLATSLAAQEHRNMHCPFMVGVQMPKAEPKLTYAKLIVYFLPPFTAKPECKLDFGEAQLQVTVGWVQITAKPETRIDVRCVEVQ